jgi:hypothetical protein
MRYRPASVSGHSSRIEKKNRDPHESHEDWPRAQAGVDFGAMLMRRDFFGALTRRHACLARFRKFPKFPETESPEGKDASTIRRLAIDPVRFGKNSDLKPVLFSSPFRGE